MKATYIKPLLPLRDIVIFPSMVVPLFVGREKSIKALQEVMKTDKSIVLVTQKNSEIDDPTSKDLYQFGCLSKVLQLLKLPDGTVKVLVEGEKRIKILKHSEDSDNYLNCEVEIAEDENVSKELEPLAFGLVKKFDRLQVLTKKELKNGYTETFDPKLYWDIKDYIFDNYPDLKYNDVDNFKSPSDNEFRKRFKK